MPRTIPAAALFMVTEPFFDFQVDGQGKVTGAVLEQQGPQGTQKIPLERK